jgi:phage tail-like protein
MKANNLLLAIVALAVIILMLGEFSRGEPTPRVQLADAAQSRMSPAGHGLTARPAPKPTSILTAVIEVEGLEMSVTDVSGIGNSHDVLEEFVTGQDTQRTHTQPGNLHWDVVTASRGVSDDLSMYSWRKEFIDNPTVDERRSLSVIFYDQALTEVARFNFLSAWPCRYEIGPLDTASAVLMETVEICHNGFARAR